MWVFDQMIEEADAQYRDPGRIRGELARAEEALEAGEIDEETYTAIEDELLGRL